jgi:hypothetical protein
VITTAGGLSRNRLYETYASHHAGCSNGAVVAPTYRRDGAFPCGQARRLGAVTATDILEQLTENEVLKAFDQVAKALVARGVFVTRVPHAMSPFGGHLQYGDLTHQSWFRVASIRRLAATSGFSAVTVLSRPQVGDRCGSRSYRHSESDLCHTEGG